MRGAVEFPRGGVAVTIFGAPLMMMGMLVLGGCSSKPDAEDTPTVMVQAEAVKTGPIESVVTADAILYPRDQAAIAPRISAPVKKFYVDRGSRVRAGQLLAELESADLRGAVTDNQGNYQQAQVNYQTAEQRAQQDLNLAKQQLDAQQKIYDSRAALFKQGAIAAKEVEDSRIALTQAQDQYDRAQKHYDLKAAEGQLTSAKGKTESAEAQLDYAKIVSPISGVVTDRPLYAGETATSGSPILTVMDLSQMVARTHVSQQEAAQIKAGDAATISGPEGDVEAHGKVTLVSPALDPSSTTVEVWVQAANPGLRLKAGGIARVTIVSQAIAKTLIAPAEALLTDAKGGTSVIVLDAQNKPHEKKVKVGIRNGSDAQITNGLKEGERVVTVGAFELDKEDPDVLAKTKIEVQSGTAAGAEDDDKSDDKTDDRSGDKLADKPTAKQ